MVVSLPIDGQRVAAVWRDEFGFWGSARAPEEAWPVGWNTQLGRDPEVRAGWLPPGAVGASVRDRAGVWHDAHDDRDVWLCTLPQRGGQDDPLVVYRDIEGVEFRLEVDVDGLPGLWPVQAGATPELTQSGTEVLGYSGGGWEVFVESHGGREETEFSPLPGTVLGQPHGFGLARGSDDWRAIAVCGSFTVEISGAGEPPVRLDLKEMS